MRVGINLGQISDWSTALPFVDIFKMSRQWVWNDDYSRVETVDARGWLTSIDREALPVGLMFSNMRGNYQGGRYEVRYVGDGVIDYKGSAKLIERSKSKDVIEVNPLANRGLVIEVETINPSNPIRNINVFKEGTGADVFNPRWLKAIQPFRVLRFMDWMKTNNSNQVNWSNRPLTEDATYSKGVPIEIIVMLCNQLEVTPWFCVPHMADDEYVRQFALLVKERLSPSLRVIVEYSNECWNSIFEQTKWIGRQARKESINPQWWYANRSVQVIRIWKEVLGDRVTGVLCTQAANIGLGRNVLRKVNKGDIDALGIAPYFGGYMGNPHYAETIKKASISELFEEVLEGGRFKTSNGKPVSTRGALGDAIFRMTQYAELANSNGLTLMGYEGGQHLVGLSSLKNDDGVFRKFLRMNRHPMMEIVYRKYLDAWKFVGSEVFCHLSDVGKPAKSGCWGAMENLQNMGNPKYKALANWIKENKIG